MEPPAQPLPTGLFGPDADAEGLVLDLLNRQDRYVARRTCQDRRRGLGATTTTLVVCDDDSEQVLPSVDLARSFPGLRTLVLRCAENVLQGWPTRFCAFVARNHAALQQLLHLDLLDEFDTPPPITAAALDSLAELTSLRSLGAWLDYDMQPASWGALRSLSHLTSLRVDTFELEDSHLQHIAAAAPQLQQLRYAGRRLGPQDVCSLASLRSLASLHLALPVEGSMLMAPSLTALPGLTHLGLELMGDYCSPELLRLLQAVGQMTGLSSLEVKGDDVGSVCLTPLAALQRLTSLRLRAMECTGQDAAVLARLAALRSLDAEFMGAAAAAAAGLQRLQSVTAVVWYVTEEAGPIAPIQLAAGSHIRVQGWNTLHCLDTSHVHVLEVEDHAYEGSVDVVAAVCQQALRSSPQLQSLRLDARQTLHPQVIQAVAACSQLTSLHLEDDGQAGSAAADSLAALAQGCGRLRRLTLHSIRQLSADALLALMRLPGLTLLRLLRCNPAVGQEQCQALVGRLGLHQLQVDVVVADRSPRAWWMINKLGEAWRDEGT